MTEQDSMLTDAATALFERLAAKPVGGFEQIWPAIAEAGFPSLLLPESEGGFGGDYGALLLVQRLAGFYAIAAPVGEAALAARLIGGRVALADGAFATIAGQATGVLENGRFTGVLDAVPWGRHAQVVVGDLDGAMFALPVAPCRIERRSSIAGEPRDVIEASDIAVTVLPACPRLVELGAFLRVGQIAGALERAFDLSIAYANERVQFGKALAKFQAMQQSLAMFAEAVAAAHCAAEAVVLAHRQGDASFETAAAKLRCNLAIDLGADIAHQVHGAIGFTQDYPLHLVTRRLQAWRAEFGNDRAWSIQIGRMVTGAWGGNLWQTLTARSERALNSGSLTFGSDPV